MAPNRKPSRPAGPPGTPTTITEIARRYAACGQALARVFGLPFTEAFVKDFHEAIACVFIEAGRCDLRLPARVTLPPLVQEPEASNRAMAEAIGVSEITVRRDTEPATHVAAPGDEMAPVLEAQESTATHVAPEPDGADVEDEPEGEDMADDSLTAGNPAPEPAEVEDQLRLGKIFPSVPVNPAPGPAEGEDQGDDTLPSTIPADAGLPCGGQGIERLKPAQLAMLLSKVARLADEKGGQWDVLRQALEAERQRRITRGQRRQAPTDG